MNKELYKVDIYNELLESLKQQEKLLKLYRELDDCIVASVGHYVRIRRQIKELENEIWKIKRNAKC